MTERALPQPAPATGWTVEVAAGPNQGATLTLAPGRYTVGAGPGNDIVLAGPGIAAGQFQLDVNDAGACVTALAPGATLRRAALRLGQRRALHPGAELRLGETRLRFSGGPAPSTPRARRVMAALGLLLLAGTGAGSAYRAASPAAQPPRPIPPPPAITAAAAPAEAMRLFQGQLAESGLDGAIRLSAADGAVLASGALTAADMRRWAAAQQWFDTRFGGRPALVPAIAAAEAKAAADPPPLDIAAVSVSPVPHVVTRSGERYMAGAVLPGGWTITAIAPDHVTLRNGAREVGVAL